MVHTGQHYDDDMSRVFFDELGLPRPEHRLELGGGSNTAQTARMLDGGRRPPARRGARRWCSSTATPTRRWPARSPPRRRGSRSPTSRPACARSTARCPRSSTACSPTTRPTCCCARPRRRRENLRAERRRAAASRSSGDVMVDVAQLVGPRAADAPSARDARRPPASTCSSPPTAPATSTTPPGSRGSSTCCWRSRCPVVFPLHPRTRARLEAAGLLDRLARLAAAPPLGYLEFTALLQHARAVLTDSGGVQKEAYLAGVPCVTLRDTTEWTETVDAGLEHARRPRRRARRSPRSSATRRPSARRSTATAARASASSRPS